MKKQRLCKTYSIKLITILTLILAGQAFPVAAAMPDLSTNSKVLTPGRAITSWQPGIPTLPGLSVSGTHILANGQPIQLHGVNMGDPFWARNPAWYPNYSTADYATLAQDWHANVVRISIFPTQWKHMDRAALLTGLALEVNAALFNGLYVIISYHVIGWPDGWYEPPYPGNPTDTYDSSMSVATSFWAQIAQTYGSDNRIIFDLWNEPAHPDDFTLYGSDPNPLWPELKLAYESLIQTVRNKGAKNIVLATGNRWASWLVGIKDHPLADTNVVYAYHKYSVSGANTAMEWNRDTGGLIGVKPVIVSEWGYEDSDVTNPTWPGSQASYGDPFTKWMDGNQLSNLAWIYHYDWTPALLKADRSLTLYGTFVKKYLVQKQDPSVVSIVRTDPNPTSKRSARFNVTFSETVTGVSASDFSLTKTGAITGAYVSGVSGTGKTRIITISTGTGNGTLRLNVPVRATITDLAGNPLSGLPFTGGQTYTVQKILTFRSTGSQDGWVLESGETLSLADTNTSEMDGTAMNSTGTTFRLGDDSARRQYRGILSFSTGASLPDTAVITSVTLQIKKYAVAGSGDPVTIFQGFMVDLKNGFFGTAALQTSDFQAPASMSYGPFNTALVSDWYSINLTGGKAYINKLSTNSGLTQIRLRFKLDDNNNTIANILSLYSGDAPVVADRPRLFIGYYVP